MRIIKIAMVCLAFSIQVKSQDTAVLQLDSILANIDRENLQLQSYALKAESYRYNADASTAWMPPMVGAGTFMTPYPGQKVMDGRDKGQIMLQLEQDIPNGSKLRAKKRMIESQANITNASRNIELNEYKARARQAYYRWAVALRRISVLKENEKLLKMMQKIEEVRYPYNQSQLGSVFQANAEIAENENMISMQEGEILRARSILNALMNRAGNTVFQIDTSAVPQFNRQIADTATLAGERKDIIQMNETIRSMELNIESMKLDRRPDFRVRFDHMFPLSSMMPQAFSVMGMISIPIAPWSSKMYKSGVRSMQLNIESMQKERAAMLQETQGMLSGMQSEILFMQQRITGMDQKILPALQKALDANFISYQENKLQLPVVLDSYEALTMMKLQILDEQLKLYQMIIDYDKELYR